MPWPGMYVVSISSCSGDLKSFAISQQMADDGPTGPTGPTEYMGPSGMTALPPPPPLSIADLLADQSVLEVKEQADGQTFSAIGGLTAEGLKPKLLQWARQGFPNAFCVHEVSVNVPSVCSDGVSRSLDDYIVFCSGKTIHQHVATLQEKLLDITVTFSYTGSAIQIVVLKA